MYPSDYGYDTSGVTTKDRAACLAKEPSRWWDYDFRDCKGNDYLYNSSLKQWTLAPDSDTAYSVFLVESDGYVNYYSAVDSIAVRPALFLKSNIQVDKGTGEKSNPYTLKMQ